jgi:tetratricopeptide (TPR) repeat protein
MTRLKCKSSLRLVLMALLVLLSSFVVLLWGPMARAEGRCTPRQDLFDEIQVRQYNLEYDAARPMLEDWLREHPTDLRALNYLATILLHREMYVRGILETHVYGELGEMFKGGHIPYTPDFQRRFFEVLDKAQRLAEARLKQNPKDEEALYWGGAAHATRAVFYFTMAKSYLAALRESTEARKAHSQLLKIDPDFIDAWLVVGVNDYVVGVLPWYLKVLASLAGYRGNRAQGIEEVRRVAMQGRLAREDAKFVLAIFYRRQKMYAETLEVLQSLARSYPRNFLLQREIANIYEIQGDLKAASKVYDGLMAQCDAREGDPNSMPGAKIFYEAGRIHARQDEWDQALRCYNRAGRFPGNDIYVYRAELAAADLDLRFDRREEARRRYHRVASAVPNTDEGKAARRALKKFPVKCGVTSGGSS